MSEEIIAVREGGLGRLTLNRPQALHALTTGMFQSLTASLLERRDAPAVPAALIHHSGSRGSRPGGATPMPPPPRAPERRAAPRVVFT